LRIGEKLLKESTPGDIAALCGATFGVILGSGLGAAAEPFPVTTSLPFSRIPGLSDTGVAGHRGMLKLATVAGRPCLFIEGRKHHYEGRLDEIRCLIEAVAATGVRELLVTSASGSLLRGLAPGTLVLITDIVDLQNTPCHGPVAGRMPRSPRNVREYPGEEASGACAAGPGLSRALQRRIRDAAVSERVALERGTMACNAGPAYETASEVALLRRIGAAVVTMSGAPEIGFARSIGIQVASVALVTNWATGICTDPLTHDDVLRQGGEACGRLGRLIERCAMVASA
jgi:purine-nucleoside phosphorylase